MRITIYDKNVNKIGSLNKGEISIDELVVRAYWMGVESVTNDGNCTNYDKNVNKIGSLNKGEISIDELVVRAYWMGVESVTNDGNCTNTEGQRKWKGIKK